MIAFKTNRKVVFAASAVALIAAGLGLQVATSAPASAQQCTSDSSDNRGCAVIVPSPRMIEEERRAAESQYSSAAPPPPRPAPHSAIAYHQDADDYWIAAMYPDAYSAMYAARNECNRAMGGGCKAVWQGSGYIGAARMGNGDVLWIVDQNKNKIKTQLAEWCKPFQLGCIETSIFHSNSEFRKNRARTGPNLRVPKDPAIVRKRYAAVAWLAGDGYNGKSWIASGYATAQQAQDVALNACKLRSNNNLPCTVGIVTGNGVIVAFKTSDGVRFIAEQNEDRGRRSMVEYCKQQKLTCAVHHVYDVRDRGAFENIIP